MADRIQSKTKTPSQTVVNILLQYIWQMCDYMGAPYPVIAGIVQAESGFDPTSYRLNLDNQLDRSYGLMHLTFPTALETAKSAGYKSLTIRQLYDPLMNLFLGITFFMKLIDKYSTIPDAISAYNGGHPLKYASGQYANAAYVNNVISYGESITGVAVA